MHTALQVVRNLDLGIYYFLSRFSGNATVCRVVRLEETEHFLKGAIFFALFWHYWFRSDGEQEKRRRDIVAVLTGAILAIVITRAVAFIAPFRLRAVSDPTILHPVYAIPFTYDLEHWSAFPSDTAAYFFALATGIACLSRRSGVAIVLYTLGWVCLPRMFLGLHYASDIAAGVAIGAVAVLIAFKSGVIRSLVAKPVVAAADRHSGRFYPSAFLISFEMATIFQGSRAVGHAVLVAVAMGLHWRVLETRAGDYSPMETWGGLVGTVACLVMLTYLVRVLFRISGKRQRRRADSSTGVRGAASQLCLPDAQGQPPPPRNS